MRELKTREDVLKYSPLFEDLRYISSHSLLNNGQIALNYTKDVLEGCNAKQELLNAVSYKHRGVVLNQDISHICPSENKIYTTRSRINEGVIEHLVRDRKVYYSYITGLDVLAEKLKVDYDSALVIDLISDTFSLDNLDENLKLRHFILIYKHLWNIPLIEKSQVSYSISNFFSYEIDEIICMYKSHMKVDKEITINDLRAEIYEREPSKKKQKKIKQEIPFRIATVSKEITYKDIAEKTLELANQNTEILTVNTKDLDNVSKNIIDMLINKRK